MSILNKEAVDELKLATKAVDPLILLETKEEERAVRHLIEVAKQTDRHLRVWTISSGFIDGTAFINPGEPQKGDAAGNPQQALRFILDPESASCKMLWVMADMHSFIKEDAMVRRLLRDVVRVFSKSSSRLVIMDAVTEIPSELESSVRFYRLPLPTVEEVTYLLNNVIIPNVPKDVQIDNDALECIVQAVVGLTEAEVTASIARSLVKTRKLAMENIPMLLDQKKQIIERGGILEFYPADVTLADVGGYDLLKEWIRIRGRAFSKKAADFGLPAPKAVLMVGVQGCGKSLTAKATAGVWNYPCLKVNMGRIMGSFLGQSEQRSLEVIAQAEAIAPCVLWIDELEKAFAGGRGASTDSGTTSRMLGIWLSWMQEKTKPVFVVATANDIHALPPEMLRKGRFDEIFFVDLPGLREREDIFRIHLAKRGRDPMKFNCPTLADFADGFSGAEIEQAVVAAMFAAFDRSEGADDMTVDDIMAEIANTVPLSKTREEDIKALRRWAKDRARPASKRKKKSVEKSFVLGEE